MCMGWSEYSTKATTNSEVLKERLKKAAFHFKGPHTWKNLNFQTGDIEEDVEIVEFDFVDLAVLLGLRDTCYQQEGDTPLSKEEVYRFLKILNKQHIIHHYISPKDELRTETLEELATYFDEWDERLVTGKVTENANGSVEVFLNAQTYMGLWRSLTIVYPGSEIDVWEYEDYDNCYDTWYHNYNRYLVKYGTAKFIENGNDGGNYDPIDFDYEEEEESNSSEVLELQAEEEPKAEEANEPSTYDLGMEYAYKGEYEKSIELLSTLEGNTDALNNIGVDYERMGQFDKAYEYYLKANTPWSLDNLLGLYNNGKIPMNEEDYINICNRLTEMGDYHGYIFMSKLYTGKHSEVAENGQLALEYAEKGYEKFPKPAFIVFNLAWCLCEYGSSDDDKNRSHQLYESILNDTNDRDGTVYLSARHNYAWQCQEGCGCEKDVSRAIYWNIRAFEKGHRGCADALANIYETEEGFINQEFADFWHQQYDKMGDEE